MVQQYFQPLILDKAIITLHSLKTQFQKQHLTTKNGNNYCLTACCAFTDYLFCIPIPNKEAETVVQAYLKHIYAHFGGSKVLITDNGTEFKNSLFKEVCDELQLTQHHITAYLPSSNLVERHHSSLKHCISKFCQKDASC